MEHRLSKRVQGRLGLLVYKQGMPVATGRITDASRTGLFIVTDYGGVQLNDTVEIEVSLPDSTNNSIGRLKAQVVRKEDDGLGVDFDGVEENSSAIATLVQWLEQHHMPKRYFSVRRRAR